MIKKQLRSYLFPSIFSMVGISCYILADTFFIAKAAGTIGIATLNLTLPIYGLIYALGAMLGVGSATRYALDKAFGARDVDRYFSNAIIWGIFIGLIFVGMGALAPNAVLRLLGADEAILPLGSSYLQTVLWFTPFFLINYCCTSFVRNDGAPNIAMAATVISGIFNIIFDYIFAFPMGMGMAGTALATGLAPGVSALICLRHFLSEKNTIHWLPKPPSVRNLIRSCRLGVVAFVGEISNGITTLVFNYILLALAGNMGVAAYGIIANIAIVGIALLQGVAQGLQPMASESHGKNRQKDKKEIYYYSLKTGSLMMVVFVGFIFVFTDSVIALFNSEQSVQLAEYAGIGMRIYFSGFLLAAINIINAGFYSATDKAKESSVIAISRGVVSITLLAFVLSQIFGILGVWLAFPVAELVTLLLTWYLKIFEKKRIRNDVSTGSIG